MSNNSTLMIACVLCVGAAPEPYLAPMLASIRGAVDLLVVNDNSGLERSENVAILEASAFAECGALSIHRNRFIDFADMRNRAYAPLIPLERPPDWVLFVDADEIHGEQIGYLSRDVLARIESGVAHLDAYSYHFFGTFHWITDIARRTIFYRFNRELRWLNPVHEVPAGARGRAVVVPYIYHHYGNVVPAAMLAQKHRRYTDLGDPTPRAPRAAPNDVFFEQLDRVRPYRGRHPAAARPIIADLERRNAVEFAALDAQFRARQTPAMRLRTGLQGANEYLRVRLRLAQRPGFYRAPTVAR
jgi:hypothetical protein